MSKSNIVLTVIILSVSALYLNSLKKQPVDVTTENTLVYSFSSNVNN